MNTVESKDPGSFGTQVHLARLCTGWALCFALALRAAEPAVGVQGTVVRYDFLTDPPQVLERGRFEVVLDGDRFSITTKDENLTEEMVSDGRVSYSVKDHALHLRHVLNPAATPLLARVWRGPHVLTVGRSIGVVWLALTSYPSRIQREAGPAPPWPAFWKFALNDPFAHALRWTNLAFLAGPADRRLLQGLDWVWSVSALDTLIDRNRETTLHYWDLDPERVRIKEAKKSLLGGRRDGEVAARYRVLRTTNYAGLEWPLEFRFELLNGETVSMAWLGDVHALGSPPPVIVPPLVSRPLQVDDHRFTDEALRLSEITYFVTNGLWPGTNDPALRQLFEERRNRALLAQPRIGPRGRLAFAFAVVVLTLVTFPVLVLKWGWLGRKTNPAERDQHVSR